MLTESKSWGRLYIITLYIYTYKCEKINKWPKSKVGVSIFEGHWEDADHTLLTSCVGKIFTVKDKRFCWGFYIRSRWLLFYFLLRHWLRSSYKAWTLKSLHCTSHPQIGALFYAIIKFQQLTRVFAAPVSCNHLSGLSVEQLAQRLHRLHYDFLGFLQSRHFIICAAALMTDRKCFSYSTIDIFCKARACLKAYGA